MDTLLTVVHIVVAIFLIIVVLLQAGKGASIGASFGGSSNTVFGARGPASFLGKLTTAAAVLFMLTSLFLSMISNQNYRSSVVDDIAVPAPVPAKEVEKKNPSAPVEEGGFDPFKAAEENEQQKTQESDSGTKE